jgi:hypothetical protein
MSGHLSALFAAKPLLDSMIASDTKVFIPERKSSSVVVSYKAASAPVGDAVVGLPVRTH